MWKWFFGSPASGVDYSKYEAVVERNYALMAELTTAQNEVERLTTDNNDLCESLSQSDFNCTEANARQANAEAACDNAYKQLAEAKRAMIDMHEDLKVAKGECGIWNAECQKAKDRAKDLQCKLNDSDKALNKACENLAEANRKIREMEPMLLSSVIARFLKWHRERFFDATELDVAKKLGEEVAELNFATVAGAYPEAKFESADVCFAAWAMMDVETVSRNAGNEDTAATLALRILDKLEQLEDRPFPPPTAVS